MTLTIINGKKVTAKLSCYFFCFILICFFSKASFASTVKDVFFITLTPHSQYVEYKESEKNSLYNREEGMLNGFKYMVSYRFNDWTIALSDNYSHGSLDYLGLTQFGRTVPTKTNIDENIIELTFSKELMDFSKQGCLSCGDLAMVFGGKYDHTNRDILSKGSITGLQESYRITLGELGLIWRVPNLFYVDWMLKVSHFKSLNATLEIDFLSLYDKEKIDLNAVYANQVELHLSYQLQEHVRLGFMLNYANSKIEKSDVFPLHQQQEISGNFYQPKREMRRLSVGLQFIANF